MKTEKQTTAIAALFGATPEQVRAQFARNARQLRDMAKKAHKSGTKINGYTADQLAELAAYAGASSKV